MDWMYLFYFSLALLLFFGASGAGKGAWNGEYTSLKQTRALQGTAALGVALHHLAQKSCGPWHPSAYITHGLDFFLNIGYLFVAVFFFCSGLGLYKSFRGKPGYLKGFFRRRVLPVVLAFYLSGFLYTGVRLLMGERMDFVKALWYLSGLGMANFNAWYVIVIPFFYLAFWAAFRFCRREGAAILWVFAFTLAYTVLCASIDPLSGRWMEGEWWYNTVILFPLGLLFGKYEEPVSRFFRKGYWFWLVFSFAAVIALFHLSEYLVGIRWSPYTQYGSMKTAYRLLSAGSRWLVCVFYVAFCFLLLMKVRLGNKALAWLGGMSLDFYLTHGLFVEMFGYSFLDLTRSVVYIRSVPAFTAAVLGCAVPASLLFRALRIQTASLPRLLRERRAAGGSPSPRPKTRRREPSEKLRKIRRAVVPSLLILLTAGVILAGRKAPDRTIGGLTVAPPDGFTQKYSDGRYTVWEYGGTDMKPGRLILDADIRGSLAQSFSRAEEVLAGCGWMKDAELYVNPHGVRMARGFSTETSDYPERRYYVECDSSMFLLCMIEDSRYYDPEDCEYVMLQTADSIRRNK